MVLTAAATSAAVAVDGTPLMERGTFTVGLASGGWHRYSISDSDGSFSIFTFSPLVGIFAGERVWLGGGVTINEIGYSDGYESGSSSGNSLHGGVDYYFRNGGWTPYAGFWGVLGDLPGDGVMLRFGARFFVVPQTSLDVGYDGAVVFDDNYYGDSDVGTAHRIWYGFQLYF